MGRTGYRHPAAVAVLLVAAGPAIAQVDRQRAALIAETTRTCSLDRSRRDPSVPHIEVDRSCKCVAVEVVRRFTDSEIFETKITASMQAKLQAASEVCR
jgi:hypothetical protein